MSDLREIQEKAHMRKLAKFVICFSVNNIHFLFLLSALFNLLLLSPFLQDEI
jgi:hypothetical protein